MTTTELNKGTDYLLKHAAGDSSWLGRYLNMLSTPGQTMMTRKPTSTLALGLGTGPANVAPGLALATAPITEMLQRRNALGRDYTERKQNLNTANKELNTRTTWENMKHLGGNMAGSGAMLGGLGGALGGALMGYKNYEGSPIGDNSGSLQSKLLSSLAGGLMFGAGGALVGGAGGALGGGIAGGVNKLIHQNSSNESKSRANDMVAKHPYLTALPFGSAIGAAFA